MRLLFLLLALTVQPVAAGDWNQAAGPHGQFVAEGNALANFSVAKNQNILWRSKLPSTGQSSAIVVGGRVFVTSHEPINQDTEMGQAIFGLCFDANSGRELWRRKLPADRNTDLSSPFSDNTAASPVADQERVCFINVGGAIACFDHAGKSQWQYRWVPFGRHHARQHQPILHDGQLIVMQVPRADLDPKVTTKAGAKPLGTGKEFWTHLLAFDMKSGKRTWTAQCGTSVHATSLLGTTKQGEAAILTGRGGGHQPPETPYGVSLIRAEDGATLWDLPVKGYAAHQNACWNQEVACLFVGSEHITVDIRTGKIRSRTSLVQNVTVCRYIDDKYVMQGNANVKSSRKPLTYHTNVLVGIYHYFRAHGDFLIGRVNIRTGKVEYLQVPAQVVRKPGEAEAVLWTKALKNDMKNADGFVAVSDARSAGSGWGHVSAAAPIVVGDKMYIPTMIGMVYVLQWNAEKLDESALLSISDLGPATKTWSLSGLTYANGRLYARTMKELICIEKDASVQ